MGNQLMTPINASITNIFQKCFSNSLGSTAVCLSIVSIMSDNSAPYPLEAESIIWFLTEAKSIITAPRDVKSIQASTF